MSDLDVQSVHLKSGTIHRALYFYM